MNGIVKTDDVMGGDPRLEGRRVSVRQVAELVIDGGTPVSEVADQLDLSRADGHPTPFETGVAAHHVVGANDTVHHSVVVCCHV